MTENIEEKEFGYFCCMKSPTCGDKIHQSQMKSTTWNLELITMEQWFKSILLGMGNTKRT